MPTPTIHVLVKDKNGVVADEITTAVSSYNEVGLFDVLPLHTNFISLIRQKLVLHKPAGDREIKVGTGLLEVINGEIHVYLGLPETSADKQKIIGKPLVISELTNSPARPE